jgi:hypothetical protein
MPSEVPDSSAKVFRLWHVTRLNEIRQDGRRGRYVGGAKQRLETRGMALPDNAQRHSNRRKRLPHFEIAGTGSD